MENLEIRRASIGLLEERFSSFQRMRYVQAAFMVMALASALIIFNFVPDTYLGQFCKIGVIVGSMMIFVAFDKAVKEEAEQYVEHVRYIVTEPDIGHAIPCIIGSMAQKIELPEHLIKIDYLHMQLKGNDAIAFTKEYGKGEKSYKLADALEGLLNEQQNDIWDRSLATS